MNDGERIKAAFVSANETVKNILTLSSAVLTVSIVFFKDINKTPTPAQVWVLEASWVSLLLAIVFGILTLMALTGTLSGAAALDGKSLFRPNIQRPMLAHFGLFVLGVVLTAVYGMQSI